MHLSDSNYLIKCHFENKSIVEENQTIQGLVASVNHRKQSDFLRQLLLSYYFKNIVATAV